MGNDTQQPDETLVDRSAVGDGLGEVDDDRDLPLAFANKPRDVAVPHDAAHVGIDIGVAKGNEEHRNAPTYAGVGGKELLEQYGPRAGRNSGARPPP